MNKSKITKALHELLLEDKNLKNLLVNKLSKTPTTLNENLAPPLNMGQVENVYKVLVDNFGKDHIEDMFTLGALDLYTMLVDGGFAGIQEEKGHSPQIGTTSGLTPDILNQILKIIADDTEDVNEEVDNNTSPLQKLTTQLQTKYPDLDFKFKGVFQDQISVKGNKSKLQDFVKDNPKGFGKYKVDVIDHDDRDDTVSISEADRPGLWANIRAKQARGEKPARKGSKAFKIAKSAGDKINKEK